ncbi:MAG: hypothetical protein KBC38_00230 [Candidatus Pacebacteria bacterium]|nr:hypothetical protein [Candidatus Paceibacterota bacterium]MBP9840426.1 hypothetical protein [Candidatus Paceibacterota bacterium]
MSRTKGVDLPTHLQELADRIDANDDSFGNPMKLKFASEDRVDLRQQMFEAGYTVDEVDAVTGSNCD